MKARVKAVERLALLVFSGAPDPYRMEYVDRFVELYKASAAAGEGNMPASWTLALDRASRTIDALGLVAVDQQLLDGVRDARTTREGVADGDVAGLSRALEAEHNANAALADAVLEQLGAKPPGERVPGVLVRIDPALVERLRITNARDHGCVYESFDHTHTSEFGEACSDLAEVVLKQFGIALPVAG